MVTHSFSHRIGWGVGVVSLEDGTNALEEAAGNFEASVSLGLFVQGVRVCGIDSPFHHAVDSVLSTRR